MSIELFLTLKCRRSTLRRHSGSIPAGAKARKASRCAACRLPGNQHLGQRPSLAKTTIPSNGVSLARMEYKKKRSGSSEFQHGYSYLINQYLFLFHCQPLSYMSHCYAPAYRQNLFLLPLHQTGSSRQKGRSLFHAYRNQRTRISSSALPFRLPLRLLRSSYRPFALSLPQRSMSRHPYL